MTAGGETSSPAQSIAPSRAARGAALVLLAVGAMCAWQRPAHSPHTAHPDVVRLKLNPNTATAAELALLPGIGPVLAQRIVTERDRASTRPAYRSLADLDRVPGLGPVRLAQLRPYLRLPDDRDAADTADSTTIPHEQDAYDDSTAGSF